MPKQNFYDCELLKSKIIFWRHLFNSFYRLKFHKRNTIMAGNSNGLFNV